MDQGRLTKLKRQLLEMRRSPQGRKAADLISIATQLGRRRETRGKEPTYVREHDPHLSPPLSIPGHPGDLKIGTAKNIIDMLLDDVSEWEFFLMKDDEYDE